MTEATSLLNSKQYSQQGKPLLILHGLFGSLNNWNWQSRELAKTLAVTALDLRNHGASFHAPDMTYPLMAADVLAWLDANEIASCCIMGHSMGGKVGMELALQHPQRVERLLVVDIAPVDYSRKQAGHEEVFAGLEAVDVEHLSSRVEADRLLSEYLDDKALRQFLLANLVAGAQGGFQWRFNLSALRNNYEKLRVRINEKRTFDKPVMFVKGADSPYIGEEHRDTILTLFPQAEVKIIMGAGHWVHADKPQVFSKIAADFFSRDP